MVKYENSPQMALENANLTPIAGILLTVISLLLSGCPHNAGHFDSPRYEYNARRPPPKRARLLRWLNERVCEVEYYREGDRWTWPVYVLSTSEIAAGTVEASHLPQWVDSGKVPPPDQSLLKKMESEFPDGCQLEMTYPLAQGDVGSEDVQGATSLSMFLATIKRANDR